MVFNEGNDPERDNDLAEALENAKTRLQLWRNRSLYSTAALLLSCALVYPFLFGHSLHMYWDFFGKYLVMFSMFLLVLSVYCSGLLWVAWRCLRDLKEGRT